MQHSLWALLFCLVIPHPFVIHSVITLFVAHVILFFIFHLYFHKRSPSSCLYTSLKPDFLSPNNFFRTAPHKTLSTLPPLHRQLASLHDFDRMGRSQSKLTTEELKDLQRCTRCNRLAHTFNYLNFSSFSLCKYSATNLSFL